MLLDNAELDKHLTATQELARRNADLIRDLESAQSQMTQANVSLAAQLRASQEQVTNLAAQLDTSQVQMANMAAQLKANQDQIARLVEHKQRSKPVVSAALPTSAPPKPSSKPPLQQLKPQRQNPAVTPSR
jgi:chromosome segregation ATPase